MIRLEDERSQDNLVSADYVTTAGTYFSKKPARWLINK